MIFELVIKEVKNITACVAVIIKKTIKAAAENETIIICQNGVPSEIKYWLISEIYFLKFDPLINI